MDRKLLGERGEEAAVGFLRRRGYRILARNYRCPLGELDIVAQHRETIVFVEVKTRSTEDYGDPLEAVGRGKQTKLTRLALYYLNAHRMQGRACRFDVISVVVERDGRVVATDHIPNAFDAIL